MYRVSRLLLLVTDGGVERAAGCKRCVSFDTSKMRARREEERPDKRPKERGTKAPGRRFWMSLGGAPQEATAVAVAFSFPRWGGGLSPFRFRRRADGMMPIARV